MIFYFRGVGPASFSAVSSISWREIRLFEIWALPYAKLRRWASRSAVERDFPRANSKSSAKFLFILLT